MLFLKYVNQFLYSIYERRILIFYSIDPQASKPRKEIQNIKKLDVDKIKWYNLTTKE